MLNAKMVRSFEATKHHFTAFTLIGCGTQTVAVGVGAVLLRKGSR
jgi:hypothetical protein